MPDNAEPIYCIDKDKEQPQTIMSMYFKHEPVPAELRGTTMYLVQKLILNVMSEAFDQRMTEFSQQPDCPFIYADADDGTYLLSKTADAFSLTLLPKPGQDAEALKALFTEVARVRQHGFTATEIQRTKDEWISRLEKIYDNRTKQKNSFYCSQYVRHFLEGNAIPDIETEFRFLQMVIQQIPDEAFSQTFAQLTANVDTNFVFLAFYPEKEDVAVPSTAAVRAAVEEGFRAQTEAYVDEVNNEPLIGKLPKAVKIGKEEAAEFGYTKWTLKNGANVYFKQTDFNDSEVLMTARSKGGTNKVATEDFIQTQLFDDVMASTGIGNFTGTELNKKLAGKQASVSVKLNDATEVLSGHSTPKDLRTLFELTYLRFQEPSNDVDGFNNFMAIMRSQLANAEKNPMMAFSDSLTQTLYNHHPRYFTLHLADMDKVDYEKMRQIYRERVQSAGDFDFYFTGAFNVDSLRAFTEQYIAPLKGVKQREEYTDLHVSPVKGKVENRFKRDMETPQACIVVMWTGETPYTMKQNITVSALGSILSERYLKSIREEGSMAYSVGAYANLSYGLHDEYSMQVYCPVKPEKMDEALALMQQGIDDIAKKGVTDEELKKFKEFQLKDYADKQRNNRYWEGVVMTKNNWKHDLQTGYEDCIKNLNSDDVKAFVNDVLLKQFNRCIVTMLPNDLTEK